MVDLLGLVRVLVDPGFVLRRPGVAARRGNVNLVERQALLSAIESFSAGTDVARSRTAETNAEVPSIPQRAETPVQRETEESPRPI